MPSVVRRLFTISGEVQGVGYRPFAQMAARRVGLVGRVRNLPDGRVEVIAQGAPDRLDQLEQKPRTGPPFSTVEHIERSEVEPGGEFSSFVLER